MEENKIYFNKKTPYTEYYKKKNKTDINLSKAQRISEKINKKIKTKKNPINENVLINTKDLTNKINNNLTDKINKKNPEKETKPDKTKILNTEGLLKNVKEKYEIEEKYKKMKLIKNVFKIITIIIIGIILYILISLL